MSGRAARHDPVLPGTGGPAGNARLTAWTGLVLLVLLAIEGATLLDVRGLIGWHIIVGALLVPPALLKVATTSWRIARFYAGHREYRRAGPPQLVLRVIGPAVVVSTLLLLATGVLLTVDGPIRGRHGALGLGFSALFLHQASFVVWLVVMTVHVLGRTMHAVNIVRGQTVSHTRVAGGAARTMLLIAMAGSSAVLAALLAGPWISLWQQNGFLRPH